MKKTFTIAVVILLIPSLLFAQGKIASIKQGQTAPFTGILLDKQAEAIITAKKETVVKICDIEKSYIKKKAEADCKFSENKLKTSLEVNKMKHDQLMKIKVYENERLRQTIKKLSKPDYSRLWFVGGFVAGVGLSIGIFYAAAQASK